jgi:hypothetical protein
VALWCAVAEGLPVKGCGRQPGLTSMVAIQEVTDTALSKDVAADFRGRWNGPLGQPIPSCQTGNYRDAPVRRPATVTPPVVPPQCIG